MNNIEMRRMWINQPSTLQPHHDFHGVNVLANMTSKDSLVTVYFLEGECISIVVSRFALSAGWK